jgi:hypothetical protein
MFTFTTRISSARSSAICSRMGETARQGPHHSAQKSTITGVSLASTSVSNWEVVIVSGIPLQT